MVPQGHIWWWPRASLVAQIVKNPPVVQESRFRSLGRYPGEGNGYPLQCSCLKNSMNRSLVGYSRWDRKELDTTECLTHTHTHTHNPTTHTSAGSPSFQLPHNPHLSGVILYIRMRVHMSSALGSASWGPQPRHHHTLTPQCASPGQTYLEL